MGNVRSNFNNFVSQEFVDITHDADAYRAGKGKVSVNKIAERLGDLAKYLENNNNSLVDVTTLSNTTKALTKLSSHERGGFFDFLRKCAQWLTLGAYKNPVDLIDQVNTRLSHESKKQENAAEVKKLQEQIDGGEDAVSINNMIDWEHTSKLDPADQLTIVSSAIEYHKTAAQVKELLEQIDAGELGLSIEIVNHNMGRTGTAEDLKDFEKLPPAKQLNRIFEAIGIADSFELLLGVSHLNDDQSRESTAFKTLHSRGVLLAIQNGRRVISNLRDISPQMVEAGQLKAAIRGVLKENNIPHEQKNGKELQMLDLLKGVKFAELKPEEQQKVVKGAYAVLNDPKAQDLLKGIEIAELQPQERQKIIGAIGVILKHPTGLELFQRFDDVEAVGYKKSLINDAADILANPDLSIQIRDKITSGLALKGIESTPEHQKDLELQALNLLTRRVKVSPNLEYITDLVKEQVDDLHNKLENQKITAEVKAIREKIDPEINHLVGDLSVIERGDVSVLDPIGQRTLINQVCDMFHTPQGRELLQSGEFEHLSPKNKGIYFKNISVLDPVAADLSIDKKSEILHVLTGIDLTEYPLEEQQKIIDDARYIVENPQGIKLLEEIEFEDMYYKNKITCLSDVVIVLKDRGLVDKIRNQLTPLNLPPAQQNVLEYQVFKMLIATRFAEVSPTDQDDYIRGVFAASKTIQLAVDNVPAEFSLAEDFFVSQLSEAVSELYQGNIVTMPNSDSGQFRLTRDYAKDMNRGLKFSIEEQGSGARVDAPKDANGRLFLLSETAKPNGGIKDPKQYPWEAVLQSIVAQSTRNAVGHAYVQTFMNSLNNNKPLGEGIGETRENLRSVPVLNIVGPALHGIETKPSDHVANTELKINRENGIIESIDVTIDTAMKVIVNREFNVMPQVNNWKLNFNVSFKPDNQASDDPQLQIKGLTLKASALPRQVASDQ